MIESARKNLLWLFVFLSFLGPTVFDVFRYAFIFLFLLLSVYNFYVKKVERLIFIGFGIVLLYNLVLFTVGFPKYYSVSFLEGKTILIYYLIYVMLLFIISKSDLIYIENALVVSQIFIGAYFLYIILGELYRLPLYKGDFLNQDYTLAFGSDKIKIYALHLNSLTYLIPFVAYRTFYNIGNRLINITSLFLGILACIISLRRGIIFSALFAVLFTYFLQIKHFKIPLFKLVLFSAVIIAILVSYINFTGSDITEYKSELTSSFDFQNNRSNNIRKEQGIFLIDKIIDKPLLGYGIGAHDNNYTRSETNPANFELQYLKLMFGTGIIGFIINALLTLIAFYYSVKLTRQNSDHYKIIIPVFAAWLSALIYNMSNPLLSQFSPLFMYFHLFYILNVILHEEKEKNLLPVSY
jgi:hypothetical protein